MLLSGPQACTGLEQAGAAQIVPQGALCLKCPGCVQVHLGVRRPAEAFPPARVSTQLSNMQLPHTRTCHQGKLLGSRPLPAAGALPCSKRHCSQRRLSVVAASPTLATDRPVNPTTEQKIANGTQKRATQAEEKPLGGSPTVINGQVRQLDSSQMRCGLSRESLCNVTLPIIGPCQPRVALGVLTLKSHIPSSMFISFGLPALSSSGLCILPLHLFVPGSADVQYKAVNITVARLLRAGLQ